MTDGRTLDILVVEDNADARATLQMLLELEGHRVRTAESGAQGVERSTAPLDAASDGYFVAKPRDRLAPWVARARCAGLLFRDLSDLLDHRGNSLRVLVP